MNGARAHDFSPLRVSMISRCALPEGRPHLHDLPCGHESLLQLQKQFPVPLQELAQGRDIVDGVEAPGAGGLKLRPIKHEPAVAFREGQDAVLEEERTGPVFEGPKVQPAHPGGGAVLADRGVGVDQLPAVVRVQVREDYMISEIYSQLPALLFQLLPASPIFRPGNAPLASASS